MIICEDKQKFIVQSILNEFDLKYSQPINTIEELYNYYNSSNIEEFLVYISKFRNVNLDGFFIKNKFRGPEYKKYKLMSTIIAMSSEWVGYSSILLLCAYELVKKLQDDNFDYVIGLTQGGIPLAVAVATII